MMTPLDGALTRNVPGANKLRDEVDETVWRARNAVHAQVAAELEARGPDWEQRKSAIGNCAWDQVWQTIGDPLYSQGWEQDAQRSEGLFEQNLAPWADAMMEGGSARAPWLLWMRCPCWRMSTPGVRRHAAGIELRLVVGPRVGCGALRTPGAVRVVRRTHLDRVPRRLDGANLAVNRIAAPPRDPAASRCRPVPSAGRRVRFR